ncbi:MAG: outer membrane beta-barrel protein [Blastocatellales bacterium]
MQRITLLVFSFVVFSFPALAQDGTQGTVFGGYSYARATLPAADFKPDFNGWHVSISRRTPIWVEMEGDLSGHYGSSAGIGMRMHTVMFGPRFATYRKKFSFHSHVLFGLSRVQADGAIPNTTTAASSDTSFAFSPGLGFDLRPHKKVGIRVIQFDHVSTRFGADSLYFQRLSIGVVFYFGH